MVVAVWSIWSFDVWFFLSTPQKRGNLQSHFFLLSSRKLQYWMNHTSFPYSRFCYKSRWAVAMQYIILVDKYPSHERWIVLLSMFCILLFLIFWHGKVKPIESARRVVEEFRRAQKIFSTMQMLKNSITLSTRNKFMQSFYRCVDKTRRCGNKSTHLFLNVVFNHHFKFCYSILVFVMFVNVFKPSSNN